VKEVVHCTRTLAKKKMARVKEVVHHTRVKEVVDHTHLSQEEESDHENDHVHLLALLVQVFVQCVHFVEKEDDKTNEPLVKERQRKESE
jgi:hypothetical protein